MEKWEIKNISSQHGRIAIITGANSGIGFETSVALARKDAVVIMACRNMQAAEKAKNDILKNNEKAQIIPMKIDLSSLESVREFVANFRSNFQRLDLLVNNAGIMMTPYKISSDGFENQLATNYLGHFALTGLLYPDLEKTSGSRIISLSSLSYKWAEINFDDLQSEKGYSKRKAYGQSKRACLVFAYELQRRLSLKGRSTTLSVAAHPGLSKTNLDRYFPSFIRPLGALFLQKAESGALPVLYAGLDDRIHGGEYIGPDGFQELRGKPTKVDSDENSKDKNIGRRLWAVSENLTGVRFLSNK